MAITITPKQICLRGYPAQYEAQVASGNTVTPGMLVEYTAADTVQPHSTAAAAVGPARMFAREAEYVGGTIDEAYQAGDTLLVLACGGGEHIYALLADGNDVAASDFLESDGAGALQPQSTGNAVAQALEAVDTTGGASETARIKVQVV